ncbi:beta-N-acetylhexosaminidase [Falsiroseomonas bella]|uniref:beta-N-acetylhexosaminidase n=1 Tax=Falsiroseomonas bella TaxID=2184016 RepID=A0A317FFE1_9PROT|nr:beta-N-acetylhexosaminidase [Falsiroseomonas bella]PWS36276.1 beta-N-acetylhexosaminidase [Falsiroseomonas bella]
MTHTRAAIVGLSGTALTAEEAALFRRHRPLGAILFRRNVESPAQVAALAAALREELGETAPILVDQEGGRVARLRPPHWTAFPPPASFEGRPEAAAEANAALLGAESAAVGLDVVCAPCLDLRLPGAHDVIGDRAFSDRPEEVARLGAAWVRGLHAAGCIPVIKHIPGHGRALVDSHESLPRVTASTAELAADIAPFRDLAASGAWAMTAHIVYEAWDAERPATLSPRIVAEVIRGAIGFDGVLVSDDLAMGAMRGLSNDLAGAAIAAGCDLVLHCTGVLAETEALLGACPPLSDDGARRLAAARAAMLRGRRPLQAVA